MAFGPNYQPICLDEEAMKAKVFQGSVRNVNQTRFYFRINRVSRSAEVNEEELSFINLLAVKKQQVYQYIDSASDD